MTPTTKPQPKSQHQLRVQLQRLLRVKEELWEECQPIPPELVQRIAEVCELLAAS